jgi:hypothetical protein
VTAPSPTVIWLVVFLAAAWVAYLVGRSWVECEHAGGLARICAWTGATTAALGFSYCYLALILDVLVRIDWMDEGLSSLLWEVWTFPFAALLPTALLVPILGVWTDRYRDAISGGPGSDAYEQMDAAYARIDSFRRALRATLMDLRRQSNTAIESSSEFDVQRLFNAVSHWWDGQWKSDGPKRGGGDKGGRDGNKDGDGGSGGGAAGGLLGLLLYILVVAAAVALGILTTAVIIKRVAATEEALPIRVRLTSRRP